MASLKKRLVWILLGLTLSAWVASALLTFVFASRVMLDQVDRQLQQYADLVSYVTQVFARQVDEGLNRAADAGGVGVVAVVEQRRAADSA